MAKLCFAVVEFGIARAKYSIEALGHRVAWQWQGVERNRIGIAKKVWHWQGEAMTVLLRRGEAQECKGMAMLGLALALCWPEMKCVGLVKSSKGTVKVCIAREWQ